VTLRRHRSRQRQPCRFADCGKTRSRVMRDMRLERPPAPFGQNAEIAARLRRLDDAAARLAAGNGEVEVRLGGDLQKDTGARPALVGLSG